jgi:uncharacterized phage-associated protein
MLRFPEHHERRPRFKEHKATQVACRFLEKMIGGADRIALMKLMYIVDREGLLRYGRPVTFDLLVSMEHGPVLIHTLNLVRNIETESDGYWAHHIGTADNQIKLRSKPLDNDLSPVEIDLIEDTFRNYGHLDTFEIRDLTHAFPEWADPKGSSTPITYAQVLDGRFNGDEIEAILEDLAMEAQVEELLSE